jgi:hypothetical protein
LPFGSAEMRAFLSALVSATSGSRWNSPTQRGVPTFCSTFRGHGLCREINGSSTSEPDSECSANSRKCLFQDYYDRLLASVGTRRRCTVNETAETAAISQPLYEEVDKFLSKIHI